MTDRTDSNVLEQRLSAIVDALEAENVAADENELWFEPKLGGGLQIRLGREPHARCYDRSANFTISYGGLTSDDWQGKQRDLDRERARVAARARGADRDSTR